MVGAPYLCALLIMSKYVPRADVSIGFMIKEMSNAKFALSNLLVIAGFKT